MLGEKRRRSISVHLFLFGLFRFVPALLAIAGIDFNVAREEQRLVEAPALRTTQDFSHDVEGELQALVRALQALSFSPALDDGDLSRFRNQAVAVAEANFGNIALRETSGQHVVNTLLPVGSSPMPTTSDPVLRQADALASSSKKPVVSNLYIGVAGKRPFVSIVLPVIRGGDIPYLLTMAITPERIIQKLRLGKLAQEGWLSSVIGSDGRVVVRTREGERFAGQPATASVLQAMRNQPSGAVRSTTLERAARDVWLDGKRKGEDRRDWTAEIRDDADDILARVPFRDALD